MAPHLAVAEQTQRTQLLTFGERLAIARGRRGIKPGEMAHELGVHRNTPSRWESKAKPDLDISEAYAKVLGNVSVEWLMLEIGDPPMWAPWGSNPRPLDSGLVRRAA